MDATTSLAVRAIVRGLRDSKAIGDSEVAAIATALHDVEESQRSHGHGCAAYDLMQLAAEIRRDCGLPPAPQAEAHPAHPAAPA